MKPIGGPGSTLFALSQAEKPRLEQAIALGLIPRPISTRDEGPGGVVVRFRSPGDAERVAAHIA